VRHAYENGREGSVEIVYELQPDRLVVEVGDEGAGFEPVDGGNGQGDELEEGGLGIEIIRALADEVEIGRREEGGSRLRFVKFFAE
jgi:anti-sigma regulatory factor (Ser/Thr protein kinase)